MTEQTIELPEMTEGVDLVEYIFTNTPNNPYPQQVLHLVYDAVFKNLVGIMQALHKPTGDTHTLLVGLEKADAKGHINTYPLARILSLDEQSEYLAPDGKGNYPDVES